MLKKRPLLFSSLLLAAPMLLTAQEDDQSTFQSTFQEAIPAAGETLQTSRSFSPFTGAITGSKVRMRVQPNLEGHVVRETAQGELFVVAGEVGDYFAIVPPKDCKGYVFRTFILDGAVEGERVNVRLYPDTDAPVIGQLNTGDRVATSVSDVNSKWLEVSLPQNSRFFVAKDYIDKKGPAELLAQIEKKRNEAAHRLSAASLFAQAEITKPFDQIDLDRIQERFGEIAREYHDLSPITAQVLEVTALMQDVYMQKKIAFLEEKAGHVSSTAEITPDQVERLAKCGIDITPLDVDHTATQIATAASKTMGLATLFENSDVTGKMLIWQPLEESLYHLWAAAHDEQGIDAFYSEERDSATVLTGTVEPYNRPVKNRPGDFLLKNENMPVAFLYSTRVNLEKLVGKKITVLAAPRPNHNFAFPAFFVISAE